MRKNALGSHYVKGICQSMTLVEILAFCYLKAPAANEME